MEESRTLLEPNGLVPKDRSGLLRTESCGQVKQFAEQQSGAQEHPKQWIHGFAP
jgi:hypothetical protein